ncbi:cysteine hydrolase family protein [Raoultibacter phocaeensis]|uniref:cysteine hydrolase family protein n=1 Tax=Raoultibacter phocaeensis TaxID=2479841 RepID=UPI00111B18AE|nr:isochorismatase family cysteine hydrolase [Raoultibacter phocaeensis]
MKKLLIVVDYQNDFVDGTLGFPGAELLEERIAAKIDEYREAGNDICFTLDMHGKSYLDTLEGTNLPVEHCIEGTPGSDLYGSIAERVGACDLVFEKPTFGSKELFYRLAGIQKAADEVGTKPFASIELVGLVSNICVIANAVLAKTACPEVPIIVDASCTDSFDRALQDKAFDVMEGLQIQVINR